MAKFSSMEELIEKLGYVYTVEGLSKKISFHSRPFSNLGFDEEPTLFAPEYIDRSKLSQRVSANLRFGRINNDSAQTVCFSSYDLCFVKAVIDHKVFYLFTTTAYAAYLDCPEMWPTLDLPKDLGIGTRDDRCAVLVAREWSTSQRVYLNFNLGEALNHAIVVKTRPYELPDGESAITALASKMNIRSYDLRTVLIKDFLKVLCKEKCVHLRYKNKFYCLPDDAQRLTHDFDDFTPIYVRTRRDQWVEVTFPTIEKTKTRVIEDQIDADLKDEVVAPAEGI